VIQGSFDLVSMWTSGATVDGSSSVPPRTKCASGRPDWLKNRAGRAAEDPLLGPVVARDGDRLRGAREELRAVGLDQDVDDERASSMRLAVEAVTAVREERIGCEAVANLPAGAAP
jgi:hypothetical protein